MVLPAPDGPDQGHQLSGLGGEGDVEEHLAGDGGVEDGHRLERGEGHLLGVRVAEVDVVELDAGRPGRHRPGIRLRR